MAELRKSMEKPGFKNVSTYIQSGNVFFDFKDENTEVLEQKIKDLIESDFDLIVSVIVLTPEKLDGIIKANPFATDSSKETKFMHVTFLHAIPKIYDKNSILNKKSGDEELVFTDEAIYLYCPNGYGNSKLSNNLIESKLKVAATTRNWKTTLKLLELAIT